MPFFKSQGRLIYFAHVPKCGGTSVEAYLTEAFGPLGLKHQMFYKDPVASRWAKSSPQHILWDQLTPLIPATMFDVSFAIVRHPMARLVSSYNAFIADGVLKWQTIDDWLDMAVDGDTPRPFVLDQHGNRQTDFIPPDAKIFKLEDRFADFLPYAVDTLGADPKLTVPHLNVTKPTMSGLQKTQMTKSQADRIHRIYSADYERLGYDIEPERPHIFRPPESPPKGLRTTLRRVGLLPPKKKAQP